ncbi:MAG: ABC transporter substrate-binding protein [Deltaproteobacteria bacterium]|nr:ABC transporter substrate-binding protein [Deltaproteobacteria bacterium]
MVKYRSCNPIPLLTSPLKGEELSSSRQIRTNFNSFIIIFVAILSILCLLPTITAASELRTMTFLPQWLPQAQFAGYYVAYEKGLYSKHGIDLKILKGGPDFPTGEMLGKNRTDFTTMFLSEAIQQRDKKIRLVNIGQLMQRSGFILVAKKGSGISKPADLQNKKVSMWPNFQIQPRAFFRKYGIEVKPVSQGATVNLFLRGGVDAASAMWYNEYHTIISSGINEDELTTFFFDRYGLNFPEDGIYVLKETYERDRELCCKFVKASLAGWKYAFEHPDEATDIVMKYIKDAHAGGNRVHQRWMLTRIKDLMQQVDPKVPIGALNPKDYDTVAGELQKSGLIQTILPFGEFYAPCLE